MQLAIHYVRNNHLLSTIIGVGLLFLCGQISIPLSPVPITLQTAAVLFIGLTFSKADALRSICSYLALGAMGAPVFANFSGGFLKIMGPTGGYLLGFLAAIWIMCALRERIEKFEMKEMVLISLIGNSVIYLIGVPWLGKFVGMDMAMSAGLMPFILPGVVKAVLVASAVRYTGK
jgi:biotin transport system substrate-specific component